MPLITRSDDRLLMHPDALVRGPGDIRELVSSLRAALKEAERLRSLATRWYLADGTFEVLPEEEVIQRRKEAAKTLKRIDSLCPGRECGEDTDYGRGWDAGVRAAQKFLLKGEG